MFEFLNRKYNVLRVVVPPEAVMTFAEFTRKFRDTANPATGKPWTIEEVVKVSGLSREKVDEYIEFWISVQKVMVATQNKMPSIEDIIKAHDGTGVPEPQTPKPPVQTKPSTDLPRTPWNPSGSMLVGSLTVPQLEDLMIHVLKEHFPQ